MFHSESKVEDHRLDRGRNFSDLFHRKLKKSFSESARVQMSQYKDFDILLESFKENGQHGYLSSDWRKTLAIHDLITTKNKSSPKKQNDHYKDPLYRFEQLKTLNSCKIFLILVEWRDYDLHSLSLEDCEPLIDQFMMFSQPIRLKQVLIVGNWMIDWNETGVIIPKKLTNELYTTMERGLRSIPCSKSPDDIVEMLQLTVDDFNNFQDYSKEKNSYYFNNHLIRLLSKDIPSYHGSKGFLTRWLKDHSFYPFCFEHDSISFMTKFDIKRKTKFSSHKEFDHFVNTKLICEDFFATLYPDDYELLIEFDKIYNTRFLEKRDSSDERSINCKFQHL